MQKPWLIRSVAAALLCVAIWNPAQTARAGGWALNTIDTMPDVIVEGETVRIELSVRQHGVFLTDEIRPELVFTGKNRASLKVVAHPTHRHGHFVASVTFPRAGVWQWEVTSLQPQKMPDVVVLSMQQARIERLRLRHERTTKRGQVAWGKALFVSKGCNLCHGHAGIPDSGEFTYSFAVNEAPDLSQPNWTADYLRVWLANPRRVKPQSRMPVLALKPGEIDALAEFLLASDSSTVAKASR